MMRTLVMRGFVLELARVVPAGSCPRPILQTIQWNHNAHTSATPGFAVYLVAAAQCLHALPHAADAETDRRRGINPAPVVAHRQQELHRALFACAHIIARFAERNGHLAGERHWLGSLARSDRRSNRSPRHNWARAYPW